MARPVRIDLDFFADGQLADMARAATRTLELSEAQLDALKRAGKKPLLARRRLWVARGPDGAARTFEQSTINSLASRHLLEVTQRSAFPTARGRRLLALIEQGQRGGGRNDGSLCFL